MRWDAGYSGNYRWCSVWNTLWGSEMCLSLDAILCNDAGTANTTRASVIKHCMKNGCRRKKKLLSCRTVSFNYTQKNLLFLTNSRHSSCDIFSLNASRMCPWTYELPDPPMAYCLRISIPPKGTWYTWPPYFLSHPATRIPASRESR